MKVVSRRQPRPPQSYAAESAEPAGSFARRPGHIHAGASPRRSGRSPQPQKKCCSATASCARIPSTTCGALQRRLDAAGAKALVADLDRIAGTSLDKGGHLPLAEPPRIGARLRTDRALDTSDRHDLPQPAAEQRVMTESTIAKKSSGILAWPRLPQQGASPCLAYSTKCVVNANRRRLMH